MDEIWFWCNKCKKFFLVNKKGDICPYCGVTVAEPDSIGGVP
jgi:RNA polymerase subunit RPABC4/transcription elongation factor Spt4